VRDHIVRDASNYPWLEDFELDSCEVVGPAVLMWAGDGISFDRNTMSSAMFWPIDELDAHRTYVGGIGIRRITFRSCTFRDIGIAAARENIDSFFAS